MIVNVQIIEKLTCTYHLFLDVFKNKSKLSSLVSNFQIINIKDNSTLIMAPHLT